jgi:hypothetical protein
MVGTSKPAEVPGKELNKLQKMTHFAVEIYNNIDKLRFTKPKILQNR